MINKMEKLFAISDVITSNDKKIKSFKDPDLITIVESMNTALGKEFSMAEVRESLEEALRTIDTRSPHELDCLLESAHWRTVSEDNILIWDYLCVSQVAFNKGMAYICRAIYNGTRFSDRAMDLAQKWWKIHIHDYILTRMGCAPARLDMTQIAAPLTKENSLYPEFDAIFFCRCDRALYTHLELYDHMNRSTKSKKRLCNFMIGQESERGPCPRMKNWDGWRDIFTSPIPMPIIDHYIERKEWSIGDYAESMGNRIRGDTLKYIEDSLVRLPPTWNSGRGVYHTIRWLTHPSTFEWIVDKFSTATIIEASRGNPNRAELLAYACQRRPDDIYLKSDTTLSTNQGSMHPPDECDIDDMKKARIKYDPIALMEGLINAVYESESPSDIRALHVGFLKVMRHVLDDPGIRKVAAESMRERHPEIV